MRVTVGSKVHYVTPEGLHREADVVEVHDELHIDVRLAFSNSVFRNVVFQEEGQFETWHWPGGCAP